MALQAALILFKVIAMLTLVASSDQNKMAANMAAALGRVANAMINGQALWAVNDDRYLVM